MWQRVNDWPDRMNCIYCGSSLVTERLEVTARGYHRFPCQACGRQFNERSAGMLNRTCLPSDVIAFVVFCRLTLRDLSKILALRGIEVSHEAARAWEAKLLPVISDELRKLRHGLRRGSGASWHVDETYLKVRGRWTYLYRAIDRDGNLIDAMLSQTRDMKAAKALFRPAQATMGFRPDQMTKGGHGSYPRAIRSVLGRTVGHRTSAYLNNRLEQGLSWHQEQDPMHARLQEPRRRLPLLQRARRTRNFLPSPPSQPGRLRLLPPCPLRPRCSTCTRHHAERVTCRVCQPTEQGTGVRADRTSRSSARCCCRPA